MYRSNKSKRFKDFQKTHKRETYMDVHAGHSAYKPSSEGQVDSMINYMAMKDLPKSTYGIKADPYQEANSIATAYPFLNAFNKTVGAGYEGRENLASGNLPQYINSQRSGLLHIPDCLALKLKLNYRYLPITSDDGDERGKGLIDKAKASIAEAISLLGATTYTELAINNYYVVTDLPMGTDTYIATHGNDATGNDDNKGLGYLGHGVPLSWMDGHDSPNNKVLAYTNPVDVLYAMLVYYQIFLQNVNGVVCQLNKFRSLQGEMMHMCWDRETPTLNELFSVTNKKAFLSKVDSLGLMLEGEYFDSSWQIQSNLISNLASRNSAAMTDPLKEILGTHATPTTFMTGIYSTDDAETPEQAMPASSVVFDSRKLTIKEEIRSGDSTIIRTYNMWSDLTEWSKKLSAYSVLAWARNMHQGGEGVETVQGYYNKYFLQPTSRLTIWGNYFKTSFNDLRVALDTLVRTGVVTWAKGFRPKIISDTNVPVYNNTIVNDIYSSTMGGSDSIIFNNITKRWRNFSLWNMYSGIPNYDAKSGGAFLAVSTKEIIASDDDDGNKDYLPRAFTIDRGLSEQPTSIVLACDRLGMTYAFGYRTVILADDESLARLVPLNSQKGHVVRVPYLTSKSVERELTPNEKSWVTRTLTRSFGLGALSPVDPVNIDPDIIAVYDYEIEDLTNDAIAYVKQHGPFRGSEDARSNLGFFGLSK